MDTNQPRISLRLALIFCSLFASLGCGDEHAQTGPTVVPPPPVVAQNLPVDSDGDGVEDGKDAFPADPRESKDSDNDGVGDLRDRFRFNAGETKDSDNDGVGDNADAFPLNAKESVDSDNDGVGDNKDLFDADPKEWADTDKDGVGDNGDAFPFNAKETKDSDGDGMGDHSDPNPFTEKKPKAGTNTKPKASPDPKSSPDPKGTPTTPPPTEPDVTTEYHCAKPVAESDDANGLDETTDYDCDGIADGDLDHGYLVDPTASTANDGAAESGSVTIPFQTLAAAIKAANASLSSGAPRPQIYLTGGEHLVSESLLLAPGVSLYGGYQRDGSGHWIRRSNDASVRSVIRLLGGRHLLISPSVAAGTGVFTMHAVTIEGLEKGGGSTLVYIRDVSAQLDDVELRGARKRTVMEIAATQQTQITAELEHVTVHHEGNEKDAVIGINVWAEDQAAVTLTATHLDVEIGLASGEAVGLQGNAYGTASHLEARISDSRIALAGGRATAALRFGDPQLTPPYSSHADMVVLERNQLSAGLAPYGPFDASIGVLLAGVEHAVLRNNFIRATSKATAPTMAFGVTTTNTNLTLINNTIIDAVTALRIHTPKTSTAVVANNILQTIAEPTKTQQTPVSLELSGAPQGFLLEHNLFVPTPLGVPVRILTGNGGANNGILLLKTVNEINSIVYGDVAANLLGDPRLALAGNQPFLLQAASAAIDQATPYLTPLAGELPSDTTADLLGQNRGSKLWDIGADEYSGPAY